MRTDDDTVASFQCKQRFEYCGRSRVGCRYDGGDQTDGFGNLAYTVGFVLFYHSASFSVAILVVDVLRSVMVFDYFVFHHAHARFFYCKFGKRYARLVGGNGGGKKNLVHLLLRVG